MNASVEQSRHLTLVREEGYRFRVRFDSDRIPDLIIDEAAPIGKDEVDVRVDGVPVPAPDAGGNA